MMTGPDTLRGELFDGRTAAGTQVTVVLSTAGDLSIRGARLERRVAFADCRVSPAVGSAPRTIELPDGAMIEISDVGVLSSWEARWGRARGTRFVERLGSRWRTVLAAAGVLVLVVAGTWFWGIPAAASAIAFRLPPSVDVLLGREAQPTIERLLHLQPSELPPARQAELRRRFGELVAALGSAGFEYDLQMRRAPGVGPNAFALPSGTIVVTDALVELAGHDDEIVAVLAHEVTHVEQRHAVRSALQDSGVALLLGSLLGDFTSITSIGATLPRVLAQAGYSRDFEREADRGAAAFCRSQGWGTEPLQAMFRRLGELHAGSITPGWLGSHPDTEERIRALQD